MQLIEKDIPLVPLWLPAVIGNLIPLYGVLFLGWDIFSVFFLYWIENVVIGIFTVIQMFSLGVMVFFIKHQFAKIGAIIGTIFFIGFFSIHYGMFTMGHLTLLTSLFYEGGEASLFMFDLSATWAFVKTVATQGMWWGILAIFIAEGIKTITDFRKEPIFQKQFSSGKIPQETIDFLKAKNPDFDPKDIGKVSRAPQLMTAPYGRIVILHVALLFGGFLAEFLNQPVWALGLLIILKIAYDMGTIDPMKKWHKGSTS